MFEAVYPTSWYEIIKPLHFGIPWAGKRFTHHINIDTTGLNVIHGRRSVYLIKNNQPLDISERLKGHGKI
ncbi:HYD1 signature containing ADP-ribosyltransferase family protein [Sessilibacter corallicola]|uniref:Tox-ART-HYD1 domain-containing protein n=1 Tax=Sessilibacter corallicola TaxID=2904075 RepID=A0ABQ0A6N5_9GAMM